MPKLKKRALLIAANRDLVERLVQSFPDANEDDEKAADAFIDAEVVIDSYLDSVAARSADLPTGPDLALACAHVLVATEKLVQDDLETLTRLNAPELGVSLYEFAPKVAEMKRRALAGLEALATDPLANKQEDSDPIF